MDIPTVLKKAFARGQWIGLNQAPTNYCHQADTEVLTDRGWTAWPEYNGTDLLGTMNTDSGLLEFQLPIAVQRLEHDGPMVYSTNRCIDFGVTPDHRMLVRKWDESKRTLSDQYTFQRAKDVGWYFGLPAATTGHHGVDVRKVAIDGDREYDGDDFVALLSLIVSDGYAGSVDKTRNWVSFACFTDRRSKVAELAVRNGFHEQPSRPGVWIRYDAPALAQWVRANCYTSGPYRSQNKRVPGIVKEMSSRQIRMFLDFYGDQSHGMQASGEARAYFSTSKRCIDDLQELLLRVGKRGSIWSSDNAGKKATLDDGQVATSRHRLWHVHERSNNALSIDKKRNLETANYKGLVYCATVPNGTLVTRRNGSILISGNCWTYGVAHASMVQRLLAGEPFVRLSPYSVACIVKNFQNNGGWGSQALAQMVKEGIATEEHWPMERPGMSSAERSAANMNAIRNGRQYLAASRANAALHKVLEYDDLPQRSWAHKMACLCVPLPIASGYNRIGHERCTIAGVVLANGGLGAVDLDSYTGDGSPDLKVYAESFGSGEDMVIPRIALPSDT